MNSDSGSAQEGNTPALLSINKVLFLHAAALEAFGGAEGIHNQIGLESALAEPLQGFGGQDLYPSIWDKAGAMGRSLISNHPFVDGNKRVGFAAMTTVLDQAGYDLTCTADESVEITIAVASGTLDWRQLSAWLKAHCIART